MVPNTRGKGDSLSSIYTVLIGSMDLSTYAKRSQMGYLNAHHWCCCSPGSDPRIIAASFLLLLLLHFRVEEKGCDQSGLATLFPLPSTAGLRWLGFDGALK